MSRRRWPDSTNSVSEKPGTIQTPLRSWRDSVVSEVEVSNQPLAVTARFAPVLWHTSQHTTPPPPVFFLATARLGVWISSAAQ